ncbi:hypothetical protein SSP24_48840 [Streptomyces spinoverrucosus]|uniref:Uncharacterized protein n=1 Tax=Streptomyces spinoverrucosus TaxID=284043 RepID=A0A4Y3VNK1_9ACTN|nr:hypothetical protein SSP24_48840 [Streptomyces spinoverrucosus]GHB90622.1 hypothetical protein GCM10010397_73510 [Streptomyces spinoverrucosus]
MYGSPIRAINATTGRTGAARRSDGRGGAHGDAAADVVLMWGWSPCISETSGKS